MGWLFTLPRPQGAIAEVPSRRPQPQPRWGTRGGQRETGRWLASSKPSPQERKATTKLGACLGPPKPGPSRGKCRKAQKCWTRSHPRASSSSHLPKSPCTRVPVPSTTLRVWLTDGAAWSRTKSALSEGRSELGYGPAWQCAQLLSPSLHLPALC